MGPLSARVGEPLDGGARQLNKFTNSRTRGRKLHRTEAKVRAGGPRKTRADLEQELKACRREIAHAHERLAEAAMQQAATSEMLCLISNSPIRSVLEVVAEHAARLCDASNARIWRLEDNVLRLVASYGEKFGDDGWPRGPSRRPGHGD